MSTIVESVAALPAAKTGQFACPAHFIYASLVPSELEVATTAVKLSAPKPADFVAPTAYTTVFRASMGMCLHRLWSTATGSRSDYLVDHMRTKIPEGDQAIVVQAAQILSNYLQQHAVPTNASGPPSLSARLAARIINT